MNLACKTCRGACCESLVLPLPDEAEVRVWLSLKGRPVNDHSVRLDARCRCLTREGRCDIYETRPEPCRAFTVGSPACIGAIRANRREHQQERIFRIIKQQQQSESRNQ